MKTLELKDFSYKYPASDETCLNNINLTVKQGEFLLLIGNVGSGKSTLLRNLSKVVQPTGERSGERLLFGKSFDKTENKEFVTKIGYVFSNPESQLVMEKVINELSFSLENFNFKNEVIKKRMAEISTYFSLSRILNKDIGKLSGGEKQKVNLASAILIRPEILILDEPLSQLDPIAANDFMKLIKSLNTDFGTTIIMSSHIILEPLSCADRVVVLSEGKIEIDEPADAAILKLNHRFPEILPDEIRLFLRKNMVLKTVREMKQNKVLFSADKKEELPHKAELVTEVQDLCFSYEKTEKTVLNNISISFMIGEIICLFGENGSGKTTFIKCLIGMLKKTDGKIKYRGKKINSLKNIYDKVSYVPQNPAAYFTCDTVSEEIFTNSKTFQNFSEEYMNEIIKMLSLERLLNKNPLDISTGEAALTALSIALIKKPEILILDEPEKGLDAYSINVLSSHLNKIKSTTAVVVITHSPHFATKIADRCAMLFNGGITKAEKMRDFFRNNYFYTTNISKIYDDAVNLEDFT